MKLNTITNWLKTRLVISITAAVLLLCVLIVLPTLLPSPSGDDKPSAHTGTLRNPTQVTEDIGGLTPAPTKENTPFVPIAGDYSLSVPENSAGQIYALPTSSAVLLNTKTDVTADYLQSALTVTPEVPITVSSSDDGFLITPTAGTWEGDTLYRLSLEGKDGILAAFQTHRAFAVESVYPAHESNGVPTDTGIEITFNDTVRNTDLAAYVSVSPSIDGQFDIYPNGRTVVIIPDEPLDEKTQYTVRVREGMPSDNGTTLSEGRVFGFFTMDMTSYESYDFLSVNVDSEVIASPGEEASMHYNAYLSHWDDVSMSQLSLTADIYAYPTAEELTEFLLTSLDKRGEATFSSDVLLPTNKLHAVYSGEVEMYREQSWENGESGWLYLPTLDEGIYLVVLHGKAARGMTDYEDTVQTLLQVTPLRAYTESMGTENGADTLVWVHSTDTGDAVAGAEIRATAFENTMWHEKDVLSYTNFKTKTDKNGLASIVTEGDTDAALMTVSHEGHTLIVGASARPGTQAESCRVYLYTDRAVYFPDDTVYFHGVLGRAYEGQTLPDTLSLSVAGNDTGVRIAVAEDGSFGGSFPIEDWISSTISFTLTDEDGLVNAYRSLRVTQEEKPLYTLSIEYDRPFYTLEHPTATVTMTLAYFDGTPAAGIKLSVYANGAEKTLTTDESGQAVYIQPMTVMPSVTSTRPENNDISVQLSGYETVSLYDFAYTYFFHSSGVMTSERVDNDHSRVTLHALDTSRIVSTDDIYRYEDGYPTLVQGAPMNTEVTVKLEKEYYVKTKTGTTYDPINKISVEQYSYDRKVDHIRTETHKVVNGELLLDHIDAKGQECSYYYTVSWYDAAAGRTYSERIRANRSTRDYSPYDAEPYYELTSNLDAALPGEDVSLTLLFDGEPAVFANTQVLYTRYTMQDGRADLTAGNLNTYRYTFDEACTVGCEVYVTVFDREEYVTHLAHTAVYDYERGSNVDMTVTTDRDTYKPGETAVITVTAPDLAGGTVRISAVDEACFALGDQTVSTAGYFSFATGRYWGSSPSVLPTVRRDSRFSLMTLLRAAYASLEQSESDDNLFYTEEETMKDAVADAPAQEAPATGGESMEQTAYVREQFLNTAAFTTVTLDENGIGTVEITVPDNITTWRLTAIGFAGTGMTGGANFTSGVRCGTAVGNTVCTLRLFLNITLPDLILSSDEVSFSARAAGTVRATDPTAAVTYSAVLYDETGAEIASVDEVYSMANETEWFTFGTLKTGEYTVVVTGICGIHSDAVRSSFRVVDTAQIVQAQKTLYPSEISALNPAAFPMTLTFFDATDRLYYDTISKLSHLGSSRRIDAKAAAYVALLAEETLFGAERTWYAPRSMADNIRAELSNNYWGFLPLLQYSEGDPILTAEVLYAAPDVLTGERKSQLISEYRNLLTEKQLSGEQTAAALMALATLDQPVLDLLYSAAQYTEDMTDAEILYLSAAFAAIGDTAAARALWEPMRDTWGQADGDTFCIVGGDTEETIHLTALALLPASVIDADTACSMVRYLDNHTSSVDLHVLELAAFLTHYTPTAKEETVLSYRMRTGETTEITLKRGQSHTLTLTASDFRAFEVLSSDEGIAARAAYGAAPADAMMTEDRILSVHKTVTPYDAENGIYRVTITVDGTTDADHLQYAITDTIPAGARYFISYGRNHSNSNCSFRLSNNGGQQVKGTVSTWNPTRYDKDTLSGTQPYTFSGSVSYLIRGAVKGTFTYEPTLAIDFERGVYAATEEMTITVTDGAWEIME